MRNLKIHLSNKNGFPLKLDASFEKDKVVINVKLLLSGYTDEICK